MSERRHLETVDPVRELRPSEDLSLLRIGELRQIFEAETVASLGLVGPGGLAEPESFRPISAPLAIEAREPGPVPRAESPSPAAVPPDRPREIRREPRGAVPVDKEVARRDWLLDPEPIAPAVEAQPYGDDPVRVRDLVQWFADGRAASASVLVPRAAGDLLDVPDETSERQARLRTVLAAGRSA